MTNSRWRKWLGAAVFFGGGELMSMIVRAFDRLENALTHPMTWLKCLATVMVVVLAVVVIGSLSGCTDLAEWLDSEQKQSRENGK